MKMPLIVKIQALLLKNIKGRFRVQRYFK